MALDESPKPAGKKAKFGDMEIVGDNEVDAWRAYKKAIREDPSREVALVYNHRPAPSP